MALGLLAAVSQQPPLGFAGSLRTGAQTFDGIAGGSRANVWTLTFDDDTGSGAFDVADTVVVTVINDAYPDQVETVTYTIVTGITDEDGVAAGFRTGWMASAQPYTWLSVGALDTSGADAVLTFTGRVEGEDYTLTVTDQGGGAVTASESTTALDAAAIYPGRLLMGYFISGAKQYEGTTPLVRAYKAADFTAMSKTWVVTGVDTAGARLVTRYKYIGVERVVSTVMDTNNDTTVANHVANLETSFNASPFTAGAGLVATVPVAGSVQIAVDGAGNVFEAVTFLDGPDTNATVVVTDTGDIHDPTYSALAAMVGWSAWSSGTAPTTIDGTSGVYAAGQALPIIYNGPGYLQNSQSPTHDDLMWIDGATNLGRAYNAAVAGYLALCWPDGRRPTRWEGLNSGGVSGILVHLGR